jgi:hypothetical protein
MREGSLPLWLKFEVFPMECVEVGGSMVKTMNGNKARKKQYIKYMKPRNK